MARPLGCRLSENFPCFPSTVPEISAPSGFRFFRVGFSGCFGSISRGVQDSPGRVSCRVPRLSERVSDELPSLQTPRQSNVSIDAATFFNQLCNNFLLPSNEPGDNINLSNQVNQPDLLLCKTYSNAENKNF